MKNVIKMLAIAGLMTAGAAQASVPASFSATPGVLLVNWHAHAALDGKASYMLEVRDESDELLASVPANLLGSQKMSIPSSTQGNLTIKLGNESSSYRIPHGLEDGGQG